jgi:hypothetical protein
MYQFIIALLYVLLVALALSCDGRSKPVSEERSAGADELAIDDDKPDGGGIDDEIEPDER